MKLLIEIPTWLGDAVMASGSINKLIEYLNPTEVIIFGNIISTELFKEHPKVSRIVIDTTRDGNRLFNVFKISKELKCDIAVTYRRYFFSKLLMFLSGKKYFWINKKYKGHLVEQLNNYVDDILNKKLELYNPKIYFTPKKYKKPTLGINPGATYGSAKRWYPKKFAQVANELAKSYDIIIFGGPGEEEIAKDIEDNLTVPNYQNLCGKLTIKELCEHIGGLELFITNDSGPMHIAAAFEVKTVAIFGPTNYTETSPYGTKYSIVTKDIECAPCMKRVCPLKGEDNHKCMKEISANDVLSSVKEVISDNN
jgi:heptosyltransferase-2